MKTFLQFITEMFDMEHHIQTHKIGKATAVTIVNYRNELELQSLRVPHKHRGQKHAEEAMKHLTQKADEHKLHMKLIASPLDKHTNEVKLRNFYGRHGFVSTDERVGGAHVMVRKHK